MKLPLKREQIWTPQNHPKFLCLIKELCKHTDVPVFTLRDEKDGLESLQTLFINLTIEDPTEATFAEVVFGDVFYWLKVRDNKALVPFLTEWRKVAAVKRKSLAYNQIINEVKTQGKSAFSAAKFLLDEPEEVKAKRKTKAEVQETKDLARNDYRSDIDNLKGFIQ